MSGLTLDIRHMSDDTVCNMAFEQIMHENHLADFTSMMELQEGEVIKHAIPHRKTVAFALRDGSRCYLKRHYRQGFFAALKGLLTFSPEPTALDEFENIAAFHLEGIPTITPIAAGRRSAGLFQADSFLVTQAREGCARLDSYSAEKPARADRLRLISGLAQLVRKMHAAGFNHRDLYLCHILRDDAGNLFILDLHRVQRRPVVPERWRVKDMAALNYSAPSGTVSRTDRMQFLKAYFGVDRLSCSQKRFALKVLKKTRKMIEHNKGSKVD